MAPPSTSLDSCIRDSSPWSTFSFLSAHVIIQVRQPAQILESTSIWPLAFCSAAVVPSDGDWSAILGAHADSAAEAAIPPKARPAPLKRALLEMPLSSAIFSLSAILPPFLSLLITLNL
jgi:hypothetical protein